MIKDLTRPALAVLFAALIYRTAEPDELRHRAGLSPQTFNAGLSTLCGDNPLVPVGSATQMLLGTDRPLPPAPSNDTLLHGLSHTDRLILLAFMRDGHKHAYRMNIAQIAKYAPTSERNARRRMQRMTGKFFERQGNIYIPAGLAVKLPFIEVAQADVISADSHGYRQLPSTTDGLLSTGHDSDITSRADLHDAIAAEYRALAIHHERLARLLRLEQSLSTEGQNSVHADKISSTNGQDLEDADGISSAEHASSIHGTQFEPPDEDSSSAGQHLDDADTISTDAEQLSDKIPSTEGQNSVHADKISSANGQDLDQVPPFNDDDDQDQSPDLNQSSIISQLEIQRNSKTQRLCDLSPADQLALYWSVRENAKSTTNPTGWNSIPSGMITRASRNQLAAQHLCELASWYLSADHAERDSFPKGATLSRKAMAFGQELLSRFGTLGFQDSAETTHRRTPSLYDIVQR